MYEIENKPKPKAGCMKRIFQTAGVIALILVVLFVVVAMFGGRSEPLPLAGGNIANLQAQAKEVSFTDLARNTEMYTGDLVYYTGKVIQVMEERGGYAMRISVTKNDFGWDDPILVRCNCAVRPLEDDIVEFVAKVDGRQSYKTVLGATVTLPMVTAQAFRVAR